MDTENNSNQNPAPTIRERERDATELAEFISTHDWSRGYLNFLVGMIEDGDMVPDWPLY